MFYYRIFSCFSFNCENSRIVHTSSGIQTDSNITVLWIRIPYTVLFWVFLPPWPGSTSSTRIRIQESSHNADTDPPQRNTGIHAVIFTVYNPRGEIVCGCGCFFKSIYDSGIYCCNGEQKLYFYCLPPSLLPKRVQWILTRTLGYFVGGGGGGGGGGISTIAAENVKS